MRTLRDQRKLYKSEDKKRTIWKRKEIKIRRGETKRGNKKMVGLVLWARLWVQIYKRLGLVAHYIINASCLKVGPKKLLVIN